MIKLKIDDQSADFFYSQGYYQIQLTPDAIVTLEEDERNFADHLIELGWATELEDQPPQDQPLEKPTEKAAQDQPLEKPAEKAAQDQPLEKPTEKAAQDQPPQDQPLEKPAEKAAQDQPPQDQPLEKPAEKATRKSKKRGKR